jgi:hypothetical protein
MGRSFTGFRSIREVDSFPCKYCGQEIFFREDVTGAEGQLVPLESHRGNAKLDGKIHRCLSPKNPRVHNGSGRGWK